MTIRPLVAAAAGVALAAALPPSTLWPLLAAVAVVFATVAGAENAREAFTVGASAALTFFALYILWLPASFGDLLGAAFWLLFPLLLAVLALFWGGTAALARTLGRDGPGTLWLLAPLWVLVEWLRGIGFAGFPWGTLGYGWLDTPIAQWADVIGIHGLSLFTTSLAALLAAPFVPRPVGRRGAGRLGAGGPSLLRLAAPVLGVMLLAAAWWGGDLRAARVEAGLPAPNTSALLVQGAVDPLGRAMGADQELDVHVDLTAAGASGLARAPELVIWPEGAVMGFPLEGFRGEPARTAIQGAALGSGFVIGGRARTDGGSANAVFSVADAELLGRYDKHVLVPFGERWPLLESAEPLYHVAFGLFGLPLLENTVPGPRPDILATPGGPVAAYVCYESVFSRIPREMVAAGATVLVNVTNDAWYSRGSGMRQHFDMGRMRAIETRRWLLRAANDGITASVDPLGRVARELPRGVRDSLLVQYVRLDELTPYVRHGGAVPWVLTGACLLIIVAIAARGRA